jgi:hypothetical protein
MSVLWVLLTASDNVIAFWVCVYKICSDLKLLVVEIQLLTSI